MIDPSLPERGHASHSDKTVRQFGGLCLLVLGSLAVLEYRHGRFTAAGILGGLGLAASLFGLVAPALLRPVFKTLMAVTFPIGLIVSRVILLVLFFGLFTPVAILFKLMGRDALARRQTASVGTSYWKTYPTTDDLKRYFRQY